MFDVPAGAKLLHTRDVCRQLAARTVPSTHHTARALGVIAALALVKGAPTCFASRGLVAGTIGFGIRCWPDTK
jgi:hypothetical protein